MSAAENDTTQIEGDAPALLLICIATHKRPRGLRRLLDGLGKLTFTHGGKLAIEIVIVDNDAAGSARSVCADIGIKLPWILTYIIEPRRGIAYARNAAVSAALSRGASIVAFIDDDEEPDPKWLDELLHTLSACNADIVTGPVVPRFEGIVARWKLDAGFFERPRHPDGTTVTQARTGNALVHSRVFSGMAYAFDERLGLSGNEDSEFSSRATRAGFRIVWADRAVIYEWNPATRTRVTAILHRAFGVGYGWGKLRSTRQPTRKKALGALVKGLLLVPGALLKGPGALLQCLVLVATGAGYLCAMVGLPFRYYYTTHGD